MIANSQSSVTINHVYEKLLGIERQMNRPSLGFHQGDRGLRYVFCQLTNGNRDGWYELVDTPEGKRPITLGSEFWGVVENIDFYRATRNNKEVPKFRLWCLTDADRVIFEAGKDTFFSKTCMAGLSRCTPTQLIQPVRLRSYTKEIQEGPNKGDNTLAVSLSFGDGEHGKIDCRWKGSDNWRAIAQQAIANVRAASGYVPQEQQQPQAA
jgi:hypothetical protein